MYEKILEELSELVRMQNFRDPILIPIPLSAQKRPRTRIQPSGIDLRRNNTNHQPSPYKKGENES